MDWEHLGISQRELSSSSFSPWSEREIGKEKRTPRCIKQRSLLTENTEIKLPSFCFTSNYVFQCSATWAGKAEREKGKVFWSHQLSLWACWHLPVFEWFSSVISPGYFPQMHEEGFHHGPVKKGPKCPHRPSLIRQQRCVRPCRSSAIHI